MAITLSAWVNKLPVLKWDHTWVTTYDNRVTPPTSIGQVIAKGEDYWYCWGDFHANGATPAFPNGYIGSRLGNLALARCICESNLDSRGNRPAQGTIFSYGVDGVCHQLANQVLWATKTKGNSSSPLTVRLARGYGTSTFFFGTYGRQVAAWHHRLASCPGAGVGGGGSGSQLMNTSSDPPDLRGDEFEKTARAVLSEDSQRLQALLALREEASRRTSQFHALADKTKGRNPTAGELNAVYNEFCKQAAKLLGDKRFELIFGVPAGIDVNIVDPEYFERSRRPPSRTRGVSQRRGKPLRYEIRGVTLEELQVAVDAIWKKEVVPSAEFKESVASVRDLGASGNLFDFELAQGADPASAALLVLVAHTGISLGKTIVLDAWKKIVLPALQRKYGSTAIKESRSKR